MQVGTTLAAALAVVSITLVGCPRRDANPPLVDSAEAKPPAAAVYLDFADINPGLYPELRTPDGGVVALDDLARLYDVDRWASASATWGDQRVVELSDADRPHTAVGAMAGWFLGPDTAEGERTVVAVLLRDFVGAPTAESPEALLLGMGEAWLPPWTLCQPLAEARAAERVAFSTDRGTKLLLVEETDGWTVEHVEFLAVGVAPEQWWLDKGYGGCEELGVLLETGRFRPARRDH